MSSFTEGPKTGAGSDGALRCPEGRVKPIYGNGGGRDVEGAGAIFSGDLQGIKARVLLSVLLGANPPVDVAATLRALGG